MALEKRPLELILARNLIAAISTPAFVVNHVGVMTSFNEAAAELIGRRFEESSRLTPREWAEIGPLDADGRPIAADGLPITAVREGRPVVGAVHIRTDHGDIIEVQVSVVPLIAGVVFRGALITFAPTAAGPRTARTRISDRTSAGGAGADQPASGTEA